MPYKSEKIKLPKNLDRRIKLSEADKEEIRGLYEQRHLPIREIARIFADKVTRRMIQFILFPDRYAAVKLRTKERHNWKLQSLKEKSEAAKKTRRYKQELLEQGRISLNFYTAVEYPSRLGRPPVIRFYGTLSEANWQAAELCNKGYHSQFGRVERQGITGFRRVFMGECIPDR